MEAPGLLRAGVLKGVVVAIGSPGAAGRAVADACATLGASTSELSDDEAAVPGLLARHGRLDCLAVDAGASFARAGGGLDGLRAALDGAWASVRAAAVGAMIAAEDGGKVVLLAPAPDAGEHAGALRDGLENMARTLSIEWARHAIRTSAVLPGAATTGDELGAVVAYLASPAGDYFSGCRLALGGLTPA